MFASTMGRPLLRTIVPNLHMPHVPSVPNAKRRIMRQLEHVATLYPRNEFHVLYGTDTLDFHRQNALEMMMSDSITEGIFVRTSKNDGIVMSDGQLTHGELRDTHVAKSNIVLDRRYGGGGFSVSNENVLNVTIVSKIMCLNNFYKLICKSINDAIGSNALIGGTRSIVVKSVPIALMNHQFQDSVSMFKADINLGCDMTPFTRLMMFPPSQYTMGHINSKSHIIADAIVRNYRNGFTGNISGNNIDINNDVLKTIPDIENYVERYAKSTLSAKFEYNHFVSGDFKWGTCKVFTYIENGIVEKVYISTDSFDTTLAGRIKGEIVGYDVAQIMKGSGNAHGQTRDVVNLVGKRFRETTNM